MCEMQLKNKESSVRPMEKLKTSFLGSYQNNFFFAEGRVQGRLASLGRQLVKSDLEVALEKQMLKS